MAMHNPVDVYGAVGAMVHFRGIWEEAQRMVELCPAKDLAVWKTVRQLAENRIMIPEAEIRDYLGDAFYHFPRTERK